MRLVLDWDGTITETDGLHLVLLEFGDPELYHEAEERLGRQLTLHEVIALEMATVTAPLPDVVAFLVETVVIRPGFTELVERHDPLVVSSGFHELIEPLLRREGVDVTLVANRLDPHPDGWRALFRNDDVCPVCGEPCKRADVGSLGPFAYVGDGFSDRCVARAADRVFARDGLAGYLEAEGVAFEPFVDFHQVARAL